jgi:hypothetical protein
MKVFERAEGALPCGSETLGSLVVVPVYPGSIEVGTVVRLL